MEINDFASLMKESGKTLGSIESFTGGLFSSSITSISGASAFFKGAITTYATEEKVRLLGIPQELVDQYGVVSQEIAGEMCGRGSALLGVDYCVSFTGNAGPTAMENKPVGEIYIGICSSRIVQVYKYNLVGTRNEIQKQAVLIACDIIASLLHK